LLITGKSGISIIRVEITYRRGSWLRALEAAERNSLIASGNCADAEGGALS
jgi:hypothetical protein